jgi:hypothetical protein
MTPRKPQKLRHGARTPNEESARDVEMREAVKAAEREAEGQADRAYNEARSRFPPGREGHQQFQQSYRGPSTFELKADARAAARKTLRERWAKEDAEFAKPLRPGLTRMTPDDFREIKNETLNTVREAYLTEVQKLGAGARWNERKRLKQALEKVEQDAKERDANEWARNRAPYERENPREPRQQLPTFRE